MIILLQFGLLFKKYRPKNCWCINEYIPDGRHTIFSVPRMTVGSEGFETLCARPEGSYVFIHTPTVLRSILRFGHDSTIEFNKKCKIKFEARADMFMIS